MKSKTRTLHTITCHIVLYLLMQPISTGMTSGLIRSLSCRTVARNTDVDIGGLKHDIALVPEYCNTPAQTVRPR